MLFNFDIFDFIHENINIYAVGGCIRDIFLNKKPKDFDFVVTLPLDTENPLEYLENELILYGFHVFLINPDFLTIRAQFPKEITMYEKPITGDFVIARKESNYLDGRHPSHVELGTLYDDLSRRDFTINAIAFDLKNRKYIDYFNGIDNIENRILRCVGNPFDRFNEDALRILRAIRFQLTLDLRMDNKLIEFFYPFYNDTLYNITTEHLPILNKLNKISIDRIRDELTKISDTDIEKIHRMFNLYSMKLWKYIFRDGLWLMPSNKKK